MRRTILLELLGDATSITAMLNDEYDYIACMHPSIHHATAFAAMMTGSGVADTCNVVCMADHSMHDDHHPMHVALVMEKVCNNMYILKYLL